MLCKIRSAPFRAPGHNIFGRREQPAQTQFFRQRAHHLFLGLTLEGEIESVAPTEEIGRSRFFSGQADEARAAAYRPQGAVRLLPERVPQCRDVIP